MEQYRLVSIAMCTYNGAKYLPAQLDTLLNQTYSNVEIVIVDDCSTDETYNILKTYKSVYQKITVFQNERNLGFLANFERAVSLCKGEFIALCDQDDLWHPKKIELQVNAIKENVFVYHDSAFIYEDGTLMNKKMSDLMNLYRGGNSEAFLFFNCVSGHSILMKKSLLEEALPLPEHYFHDWWLAYVATNVGTIDFIPECLVQYRQHDESETNILKLTRTKDNYNMSADQNYQRTLNWLAYCAGFKGNKNKILIEEIYNEYKQLVKNNFSLKLSLLLFKHLNDIYYIRKRAVLSKLNFIRKQARGVKKIKNIAWRLRFKKPVQ